ncbi:MAG: hypothetical protein AVDCRST_MAG47-381 [uncultured Nocardioidaceae bacterium]|uniref:Uncharacterized protein n=1 Tax=uncultured Nocardioidaceae bacterium TaxID=253824 RepID=A0A6J4MMH8_9ACTN|nr:MAG: hypothetical protein AVDCRST_MAG47-381 [uncultured Nocardioidaceae bacterium]
MRTTTGQSGQSGQSSRRTGGWQSYHLRADAVRGVLARLDGSLSSPGSLALPWDDALASVFLDPDDLLEALHGVWTRRLLARVDLELETGTGTPRQSVETAWRATRTQLPALRTLLDRYADTDVAQRCVTGEHRLLAVAAGLATLSDPAPRSAGRGAELVASLQQKRTPTRHRRTHTQRLSRLLGCRHGFAAA